LLLPDGADARRGGGAGFRAGGFHASGFRSAGMRPGWHGAGTRWAGNRGWRRGWGGVGLGVGVVGLAAGTAWGSACYQPQIVWNGRRNVRRWVWVC
jgi:hypothetical protein